MLGVSVCWRTQVRVTSRSCTAAAAAASAPASASTKVLWDAYDLASKNPFQTSNVSNETYT